MDTDRLAGIVAMAIKAAMAPYQERIAALESTLARVATIDQALVDLRDRVTVSETKAAAVVIPDVPVVDLAPVYDRLATVEARSERVAELDKSLLDLRDRMTVSEMSVTSLPSLPEMPVVDLSPVHDRLTVLEQKATTLGERVAAVEVKPLIPGPQGPAGKDGKDGKDGADGFGFEETVAEQTDERTVVFKGVRGDRVKEFGRLVTPAMIQRGTWLENKAYERGDVVTWAGSQWHADRDTSSKPGEGATAWTLVVKRGRDGKDGRDGLSVPPVVKVHAS